MRAPKPVNAQTPAQAAAAKAAFIAKIDAEAAAATERLAAYVSDMAAKRAAFEAKLRG